MLLLRYQLVHFGAPASEEDHEVSVRDRTLYRYMSRAEAEAVRDTGYLRGGIPGEVYWTNDYYESALLAMRRLALGSLPEVRMRFRILDTPQLTRDGVQVRPDAEQPGGGTEYMSEEKVRWRWSPLITLSEERVGRLLVGQRVRISVGEPWDFESADGPGALGGWIVRVVHAADETGSAERPGAIELEVTPFESKEGVRITKLTASQRYLDKTTMVEQVAAGEAAPANLDYSDQVPEERRKADALPKLIGSLRLVE